MQNERKTEGAAEKKTRSNHTETALNDTGNIQFQRPNDPIERETK